MKPGDDNKRQVVLRQQQCHGCGCTFVTGSPSVTVCDLCLSLVENLSIELTLPADAGKDFKP